MPIRLEPNARLLVTILDPAQTLLYDVMNASTVSLSQVWDNDEDAVYDASYVILPAPTDNSR